MDKMDTNNEAKQINEDELEHVSGGDLSNVFAKCWFTRGSDYRVENGTYWWKCNSTCWTGLTFCPCVDSKRCVNSFHIMEKDGALLRPSPKDNRNHSASDKAANIPG